MRVFISISIRAVYTYSLDSLSPSIPIDHHSWQVHYTTSSVPYFGRTNES